MMTTETCPATDHEHHAGANYYVSMYDAERKRTALLAGPFATHGEALAQVPAMVRWAEEQDAWTAFYAFGTLAMAPSYTRPGVANEKGWAAGND